MQLNILFASALALASLGPVAVLDSKAQDSDSPVLVDHNDKWDNRFDRGGVDGVVYAVAKSGSNIYVGGNFSYVGGGIQANSIARWDGRRWWTLGNIHNTTDPMANGVSTYGGSPATVRAIAVCGNDVYVGGDFSVLGGKNYSTAGSILTDYIGRWDGTNWHAVGVGSAHGVNGQVRALVVNGSDVYVGGSFTSAGGIAANYIARWNGTAWSSLGTGTANGLSSGLNGVNAMLVEDDTLYVAGDFLKAGGQSSPLVAKWDGASWSRLGNRPVTGAFGSSGQAPSANALASAWGQIYVGGCFNWTTASGVTGALVMWDGDDWNTVESGGTLQNNNTINALAAWNGELYALGPWSGMAKFDGGSWTAMSSPLQNNYALVSADSCLFAGGNTSWKDADGTTVPEGYHSALGGIAQWDGSAWSPLTGNGLWGGDDWQYNQKQVVSALHWQDSALAVGGSISRAGATKATNLLQWTESWDPYFYGGVQGYVQAMAGGNGNFYIGGNFSRAGEVTVANIARWDGTWNALGTGINGEVRALALYNDGIVAGGQFSKAGGISVSNIAVWNGTAWHALGTSGPAGKVNAVCVDGQNIYVGGAFSKIGTVTANAVAMWDGQQWVSLGGGLVGSSYNEVYALALFKGKLYAAGSFYVSFGEYSNLAVWDGAKWKPVVNPLGVGLNQSKYTLGFRVRSLEPAGDSLFVGGAFDSAGTISASNIARWDGVNWFNLGAGVDGEVFALADYANQYLAVGGNMAQAGGHGSYYFSIWDEYLEEPQMQAVFQSPAPGAVLNASSPVDICFNAPNLPPGGGVRLADFFTAPGSQTVSNMLHGGNYTNKLTASLGVGHHKLVAVTIDNVARSVAVSAPLEVDVTNLPPQITILRPESGTIVEAGNFEMAVDVSDPDGTVTKVSYLVPGSVGAVVLGIATTPPFSAVGNFWASYSAGQQQTLLAVAQDNLGLQSTNSIVIRPFAVSPVRLTSPLTTIGYNPGTPILLEAAINNSFNVGSTDFGTYNFDRVEFYEGATLLGSAESSPYRFVWNGAAPGQHSIYAKAYSQFGDKALSQRITFTILDHTNTAPSISIIRPTNNAVFVGSSQSIVIQFDARDADDRIAKIIPYVTDGKTTYALEVVSNRLDTVFNVTGASDNTLYAVAIDSWGLSTTSAPVHFTIVSGTDAPSITVQPTNATISYPYATYTTLSVTASGAKPLHYQWYHDGKPLGEGGAQLPFSNPSPDQAGHYAVVISNVWGAITSSPALLTIQGSRVSIRQSPTSQIVHVGEPASMRVDASAIGNGITLGYQWLKNGQPVANATNSVLNFANAQKTDQGAYSVAVSDGQFTATSAVAQLTVKVPLAIVGHPQNTAAVVGSNVTLQVVATGEGITYEWRYNGSGISRATNASLTFSNIQANVAGIYSVSLSDGATTLQSRTAYLVVNDKSPSVSITKQPASQTVPVGGTALFQAVTTGGPYYYQWLWNGYITSRLTSATNATLTLTNVSYSDAGTYTVLISNPTGLIPSAGAELVVVPATAFAAKLVKPQPNAAFKAPAPVPLALAITNYTAAIDTVEYLYSDGYTTNVIQSFNGAGPYDTEWNSPPWGSLEVWALAYTTDGRVAVSPRVPISVTGVGAPPQIVQHSPARLEIFSKLGATVTLSVLAKGEGTLSYQWMTDGEPLKDSAHFSGSRTPTLSVRGLTSADNGSWYYLVVSNEFGTATSDSFNIQLIGAFVSRQLPATYTPGQKLTVTLAAAPDSETTVYALEDRIPDGWNFVTSSNGVYDSASRKVKFGPFFDHIARTLTYEAVPPMSALGSASFSGLCSEDTYTDNISGDYYVTTRARPVPIPADLDQDNRVTLEELTYFAKTWKSGQFSTRAWFNQMIWEQPSVMLPRTRTTTASYVTRAAMLWTKGETYYYVPELTPPLCWTNDPQAVRANLRATALNSPGATRSIPATYLPGAQVNVQINVVPSPDASAYAIEETPPPGWTVSNINNDGVFDPGSGIIKWGPFFDKTPRDFTFQLQVPAEFSGPGVFTGSMSQDGMDLTIEGGMEIAPAGTTPPVSLRIDSPAISNNNLEFLVSGTGGSAFTIELSTNLVSWDTYTNIPGSPDPIKVTIPVDGSATCVRAVIK